MSTHPQLPSGASETAGDAGFAMFHDRAWLTDPLRALLIPLLATCAAAAPLALLRRVTGEPLGYALLLALLAAVEGAWSTRRLGRPEWRDRRGLLYRSGEVTVVILLVRLVSLAISGVPLPADPTAGPLAAPGFLLDIQFLGLATVTLLAWGLGISITSDFAELAIRPDEMAAHAARDSSRRAFLPTSRSEIVARLTARWGWGAVLLVLCAGMTRVVTRGASESGLPLVVRGTDLAPDLLLAVPAYFAIGLLLLSDARLAYLRGAWYNQNIAASPQVSARWRPTAAIMLLAAALLAALLPLGSAGRPGWLLQLVLMLFVQVAWLILVLFGGLLALLLYPLQLLLPSGAGRPELPEPLQLPPAPPTLAPPSWLGAALSWSLVIAVVLYLLSAYLRAQGWSAASLRWVRPWSTILPRRFRLPRVRWRLRSRRSGSGSRPSPSLWPLALRGRARVRYLYLQALRRAGQLGVPRPPASTPAEHLAALEDAWPEAGEDAGALTEAFARARYAPAPAGEGDVRAAERAWRGLRRVLRRRG